MTASQRTGRLLVAGELRTGRVVFEGETISAVELDDHLTGELPIIAPGLIDLHVHGFGGADPYDDLAGMGRHLALAGTTAFLPTLFPRRSLEVLGNEAGAVWAKAASLHGGATPLGIHLEGPFINPGAVGGLPPEELAEPSPDALRALLGPATGDGRGIRAITLAPELAGSPDLIEELARCGVRVSMGHSLATTAEASAGLRAGADGATHLFNAMRPLHHREAGIAGVALTADELLVEIIGDLVHVGREAFTLAVRARGPEGLCLVSDALKGPDDEGHRFCSHGRDCTIEDGAAWFDDSTAEGGRRLTGTVLAQLDAVRRLVSRGVVTAAEALTMASSSPARALGLQAERGSLLAGARADLLVLAGDELALEEVVLGGQTLA